MKYYTTTQTLGFSTTPEQRSLVVDVAAGGLTVEAQSAIGEWVTTDTITTSGAFPLFSPNLTLRFTPSGGCKYAIDERTGL